jgi:hypothetical protein
MQEFVGARGGGGALLCGARCGVLACDDGVTIRGPGAGEGGVMVRPAILPAILSTVKV